MEEGVFRDSWEGILQIVCALVPTCQFTEMAKVALASAVLVYLWVGSLGYPKEEDVLSDAGNSGTDGKALVNVGDQTNGQTSVSLGGGVWHQQSENEHHPKDHVKAVTLSKKIPKPYPVEVEKKVPYEVRIPFDRPYPIYIPQPYPVYIEKKVPFEVKVPVPQPFTIEKKVPADRSYRITVEKPYPVLLEKKIPFTIEKHIPYTIKVPGDKAYGVPVPADKDFPYRIEGVVHYPVNIPSYHVEQPVPYQLEKNVPYPVVKDVPYRVKVPNKFPVKVAYIIEKQKTTDHSSSHSPLVTEDKDESVRGQGEEQDEYTANSEMYEVVQQDEYQQQQKEYQQQDYQQQDYQQQKKGYQQQDYQQQKKEYQQQHQEYQQRQQQQQGYQQQDYHHQHTTNNQQLGPQLQQLSQQQPGKIAEYRSQDGDDDGYEDHVEFVSTTVQVQDPKESEPPKPIIGKSYSHNTMHSQGKQVSYSSTIDHY